MHTQAKYQTRASYMLFLITPIQSNQHNQALKFWCVLKTEIEKEVEIFLPTWETCTLQDSNSFLFLFGSVTSNNRNMYSQLHKQTQLTIPKFVDKGLYRTMAIQKVLVKKEGNLHHILKGITRETGSSQAPFCLALSS